MFSGGAVDVVDGVGERAVAEPFLRREHLLVRQKAHEDAADRHPVHLIQIRKKGAFEQSKYEIHMKFETCEMLDRHAVPLFLRFEHLNVQNIRSSMVNTAMSHT